MAVVSVCVIGLLLAPTIGSVVTATPSTQPAQPETDNTVTRIHVYPNGSAQWAITIRTRLDTEERVSEYEAFQAHFRNNTSRYLDTFRKRMGGVVANAGTATGREMHAVNFTASTTIQEVPRRWGVTTYQFTWTNFTASEDDELIVGDIFQGGLFLATNDTLQIETPTGYTITHVAPEPVSQEDGVVTWVGRKDFANRHPRVVFAPFTDTGSTTPTEVQQTSTLSSTGGVGPSMIIGGMLLVGLVGVSAYTLWRHRENPNGRAATPETEPEPESAIGTSTLVTTEEEAMTAAEEAEIMTDAERVQKLLEASDGRMRQAAIADELDWSASKTSRVISNLVDEGTVEKLQLGRENLIDLANDE